MPNAEPLADLLNAAADAYSAGRFDEAAALYTQAEALDPGDLRAPYSLAVIDLRQGRFAPVRDRLSRIARQQPGHFAAQHNLGAACQALRHWDEAAAAFAAALAVRPDAAETRFNLATALAILGRTDAAVEAYRVLAAQPATRLRALIRLAVLKPEAISDDDLATLTAAVDVAASADVLFAVAGVHDARGADAEAFAAYASGNRLRRHALVEGPSERHPAVVQAEYDQIAAQARRGDPGAVRLPFDGVAPVFIVGMPRSGSTLIEQILASHPAAQGLGETGLLSEALDRLPADVDDETLEAVRADYLAGLRDLGWDGVRRPVDKTLANHLHVGLIRRMFPGATVLHSLRDPVESCVACWRQLFGSGNETLYDFADIATAYRAYRDLMNYWRSVLPGAVTDTVYEDMVADPEGRIRWLVTEACGLAWDPACLDFHQTARSVESASAAQVRRPIFSATPYRERYGEWLAPLLEALGT